MRRPRPADPERSLPRRVAVDAGRLHVFADRLAAALGGRAATGVVGLAAPAADRPARAFGPEVERQDRIGLDRLVLAVAGVGGALLVLPAAGRLAQQVAIAGQRVGRDQGRRRVRFDRRQHEQRGVLEVGHDRQHGAHGRAFQVGARRDRGLADDRLFGEVPWRARAVALEHDVPSGEHRPAVRQPGDDVQLRRGSARQACQQRVDFGVHLPARATVDEQVVLGDHHRLRAGERD